jgi:uncharacterized zinc-type alcohol dehydrogenase-like protein
MTRVNGYAAYETNTPLKPFKFERRTPGATDVQIDLLFCGVCHSDLHSVNGDWSPVKQPLVPGHEMVGRVEAVGPKVKKYKVGDMVGVGCLVDSCKTCEACKEGLEQYCEKGATFSYGSPDVISGGITQGGYSAKIVTDESFVVRIPNNIPPDRAAPLLCAGITTYSPLRHWQAGPGKRVAIAGLGGLGHMGVKLAKAMGAHVTVLTTSESKRKDAMDLGATEVVVTKDQAQAEKAKGSFDLILNTISANHDYNMYLNFLKRDGAMVLLGLPEPQSVAAGNVIMKRRSLAGSLIGGIAETQEMLNFCSEHGISADIETIAMKDINEAFVRMVKGDVHYRFVIDLKSLK